jgi:UDP-GlcNAc:undecaprenyl-phosphate GlcNAc-1-phosphate transferase
MPDLRILAEACALTCVLSAALTYLLTRFSLKLHLVAQPVADRWHKVPTANTGGIAVVLSCIVAYVLFGGGSYRHVAIAAGGIALLGALDDRLKLRPIVKFAGQSIAVISVMYFGVVFRPFNWEPADLAITFLWIAGLTNAFNLIDNMDGLCAGVVVIIGCFRCLVAIQSGDVYGTILAAIVAGGFLGFLFFNYKPAKIFMGDAGSMFAGFTLSALTIAGPVPKTRVFLSAFFYPALTFLYPVFDTMLVSIMRRAAGRPISVGGRDHSSHRLASLGHHEAKVVWVLWLLTAVGAATGWLAYWYPLAVNVVGLLLVVGVSVFGLFLATLPDYTVPISIFMQSRGLRWIAPTLRVAVNLFVETLLAGVALICAFVLRWGDDFAGVYTRQFLVSVPIVMACQLGAALLLRTWKIGWRWFGVSDAVRLGEASLLSAALSVAVLTSIQLRDYSRGVLAVYVILVFGFSIGLRLCLPVLHNLLGASATARNRAVILGAAGDSAVLMRVIEENRLGDLLPVLILDTGGTVLRARMFGVPVVSFSADASEFLRRFRIDSLVVTQSGGGSVQEDQFLRHCLEAGIAVHRFQYDLSPVVANAEALAGSYANGPSASRH